MGWTDALGPPKVEVGYRGQGADGKVGEQDGWGGGCWQPRGPTSGDTGQGGGRGATRILGKVVGRPMPSPGGDCGWGGAGGRGEAVLTPH